jgi:glutamate dehydrogenase (NAD(P)+)
MAWIMDEYSRLHGFSPAVVTGKPVDLFGSKGREEATGRGVVMALDEYLKDAHAGEIKDKTFAVQGFGNVGSWTAKFLRQRGGKVVAISDVTGAIKYRPGLDIPSLVEHVKQTRSVLGFPGAETISNDELLTLDVDVLVPAALGAVITMKNVNDIRARIVLEAANAPTSPDADETLAGRGVVVLPDIYVNAGGVTVSYFEWAQNIQQFKWKEDRFNQELRDVMTKAFDVTIEFAESRDVSMRRAAFAIGIERVARAARMRGYV